MCMFCRSLFGLLPVAIVLSVLLRFTDFDYSYGIFKHFLVYYLCPIIFYALNLKCL